MYQENTADRSNSSLTNLEITPTPGFVPQQRNGSITPIPGSDPGQLINEPCKCIKKYIEKYCQQANQATQSYSDEEECDPKYRFILIKTCDKNENIPDGMVDEQSSIQSFEEPPKKCGKSCKKNKTLRKCDKKCGAKLTKRIDRQSSAPSIEKLSKKEIKKASKLCCCGSKSNQKSKTKLKKKNVQCECDWKPSCKECFVFRPEGFENKPTSGDTWTEN